MRCCESKLLWYWYKKICKSLNDLADYFAVSSADEFYKIRRIVSKPIVILDPVFKGVKRLINLGAEIVISNLQTLKILLNELNFVNKKAKVHITVNLGMNRFGFGSKKELYDAIMIIKKSQKIVISGVFVYYFGSNNENFANLQFNKFINIKKYCLENFALNCIYHIAYNDKIVNKTGFDMMRVGMALYTDKRYQTITLKSKILDIQNIADERLYYGVVDNKLNVKKVAIVDIGYGDGLLRNIVKNGYVLINGNYAKMIAIFMDTLIVDVTKINAKIYDEVVIIGRSKNRQIFICDIASWCDTIDYEITLRLSNRIQRKYLS